MASIPPSRSVFGIRISFGFLASDLVFGLIDATRWDWGRGFVPVVEYARRSLHSAGLALVVSMPAFAAAAGSMFFSA